MLNLTYAPAEQRAKSHYTDNTAGYYTTANGFSKTFSRTGPKLNHPLSRKDRSYGPSNIPASVLVCIGDSTEFWNLVNY